MNVIVEKMLFLGNCWKGYITKYWNQHNAIMGCPDIGYQSHQSVPQFRLKTKKIGEEGVVSSFRHIDKHSQFAQTLS